MAKKKRRAFTRAFKLDAAQQFVIQGFTQREVAKRLGIIPWSIREWIKTFLFHRPLSFWTATHYAVAGGGPDS